MFGGPRSLRGGNLFYLCPTVAVTARERDWLNAERKRAASDRAAMDLPTTGRKSVGGHPYRGYLRVIDRDRDGSLRAAVRVYAGAVPTRYVRRLRCTLDIPWREPRTVRVRQGDLTSMI